FEAGYRDRQGATHHRKVLLSEAGLCVEDDVSGFQEKAVLRWRLAPGSWRLDGNSVTNGIHVLRIGASVAPARIELVEGWESRYYMEKSAVPVLEVELDSAATITSEYRWRQ
ncbi:MAG: heparinase II/III domain-containing protein, partial [Steroidobacteraceae bacterium]